MKNILSIILALCSILSFGQDLSQKDASNAYLVFRRGDGIDTYYKISNGVQVFVDKATIGRRIVANSDLELVGFGWTQELSGDIYKFLKPVDHVLTPVEMGVQLKIPGYDDVSDIWLADGSLKVKDSNKLDIQLATHSISLGEQIGEKRSFVNYKITDQTGKEWVKVVQKKPTIEGRLGGAWGNNHPDKAYINWLPEDCNIFLPLGNTYTVTMENLGDLDVDFWVIHPWSEHAQQGEVRELHRERISPDGVKYYNIDTNAMGLAAMPDYMRTIKINCNGVK